MRNTIFKIGRFAVIAALMLVPTIAHAQLTATAPVTVSLNVTESISASCTPTSTDFTDVAGFGGTTTTAPVTCQADWALASARTHLDIAWVLPGGNGAFLTSGSNTLTPAQPRSAIEHHSGQQREGQYTSRLL